MTHTSMCTTTPMPPNVCTIRIPHAVHVCSERTLQQEPERGVNQMAGFGDGLLSSILHSSQYGVDCAAGYSNLHVEGEGGRETGLRPGHLGDDPPDCTFPAAALWPFETLCSPICTCYGPASLPSTSTATPT